MKINAHTRIKVLLDQDQVRVIDSLIKLKSNFSKLRNPILQNLLARRVTIADACKMGKCEIEDFLSSMQQIGFVIDEAISEPIIPKENPIDFNHQTTVLELDARTFLNQKKDPLREILQMANRAGIGERLKVINSFEPVPLISLLADKGFLHHTEVVEKDLVVTWFEKTNGDTVLAELPSEDYGANEQHAFDMVLQQFPHEKIKYIDVRHLEMPLPMMQILESANALNDGELLYVYHKKVPVYLLPELKKKDLIFLLNHKSATEVDMLIYGL
ncbi:DUF2249 domain-containing protein [Pedobacter ginsengisoli]|uniref:DUF2249 domain-containing protein n=1 Tax=Pedobacter ginsengisoli TaxID=363852 RepID=UPI002551C5AB|nr:DUF2249 domain-containing protein [Pedobacter ginsengisoli]